MMCLSVMRENCVDVSSSCIVLDIAYIYYVCDIYLCINISICISIYKSSSSKDTSLKRLSF
jgi:hypothetical protein